MLVNADCTLYILNGKDYKRLTVQGVHWEDTKGANLNKTGSTAVDSIVVYIPFSSLPSDALTGKVSNRDYIIRGILPDDGWPVSEIVMQQEAYTITSVKKCDYGSPVMQHWEVGAK